VQIVQAVLLPTGIAVRHRNRRGGTFGAGNEQPTAQRHAALDPELDIFLSAIAICFSPLCSTVVDPVSVESYIARSTVERTALDEVPECLCSLCETGRCRDRMPRV
jgi:hypothetical protein